MKRIHIIGISGSGKSYLADKISKKLNIEKIDLDDIYWENKFSKKRELSCAKKLLNKKLEQKDNWITEGIYTNWISYAIENSDKIIWIQIDNNLKLSWRIFSRWWKRRGENIESILSMIDLLKFQWNYKRIRTGKEKSLYSAHRKMVEKYKEKLIILKSEKEVNNFIKNLKK